MCHLHAGNITTEPSNIARNLGVIFDQNLTFKSHISYVAKSVRLQLRNMSFIRKYLSKSAAELLIHSLISSRLDFSNSHLSNLPLKEIAKLQRLQNSAARLLTYTKKYDHITPVLRSLHWLPVEKRISFKILLLMHHILYSSAPAYLQNSISFYRPARNLRSSEKQMLTVPQVKHSWGNRAFSVVGPKLLNSLPITLRQISSTESFKSSLKTYLFNINLS